MLESCMPCRRVSAAATSPAEAAVIFSTYATSFSEHRARSSSAHLISSVSSTNALSESRSLPSSYASPSAPVSAVKYLSVGYPRTSKRSHRDSSTVQSTSPTTTLFEPAYASPSSFQAGARALQWPHLNGVGAVSFRRSRAEREIANGEARGTTQEGRSERVVFVACQRRVTLSSS